MLKLEFVKMVVVVKEVIKNDINDTRYIQAWTDIARDLLTSIISFRKDVGQYQHPPIAKSAWQRKTE